MTSSLNWFDISPELPENFERSSFNETEKGASVTTSMSAGPNKVRRRFSATRSLYSGNMIMDASQKSAFKVFYQTTTRLGELSFNFYNPSNAGFIEVQFNGPPVYKALANSYWGVSFNLKQYGESFAFFLYDLVAEDGTYLLTQDDDQLAITSES